MSLSPIGCMVLLGICVKPCYYLYGCESVCWLVCCMCVGTYGDADARCAGWVSSDRLGRKADVQRRHIMIHRPALDGGRWVIAWISSFIVRL